MNYPAQFVLDCMHYGPWCRKITGSCHSSCKSPTFHSLRTVQNSSLKIQKYIQFMQSITSERTFTSDSSAWLQKRNQCMNQDKRKASNSFGGKRSTEQLHVTRNHRDIRIHHAVRKQSLHK
ncbi:hypothetical protein XELAEV_18044587mg [Xenopus laevis]|uniref:Uncharacterized protein n=1 Tax=Xenopus laevis TaxID=8355 RepID=A0A974BZ04_XENLA|nr:hypothetical protein XELAEV_18044587mg [Xenopus laevis]